MYVWVRVEAQLVPLLLDLPLPLCPPNYLTICHIYDYLYVSRASRSTCRTSDLQLDYSVDTTKRTDKHSLILQSSPTLQSLLFSSFTSILSLFCLYPVLRTLS